MSKEQKRRDTTVEYEALDEHPDKIVPPFPCNRWAKKITKTHEGKVIEEQIMPWLDECKGKEFPCGAAYNPETKQVEPAYRSHKGFDEIDYVVIEENAFKYDEEGNIVVEKDEKTGAEVPVSDFKYIAGINAMNFIAEHTFRMAGMTANSSKQTMAAIQALNNNLVQLCKMQAHMVKLATPASDNKIDAAADQSALPSGPRIEPA